MKTPWDVRQSRTSESAGPHPQRTARVGETLVPRWVPYTFAGLSLALIPGIARVSASAPPLAGLCLWVAVLYARAVEVAWPYVRSLRMEAARKQVPGQPGVDR
jgi:hypothetical protein